MLSSDSNRRQFLKSSAAVGATALFGKPVFAADSINLVDDFKRPDSLFHGIRWETQNPGYWQIKNEALRRRLTNVGDRARRTGFPFHSSLESNPKATGKMITEYDPSLPMGLLWWRDEKVKGAFVVEMSGTYHGNRPDEIPAGDDESWKMYSPGNGVIGITVGGKSVFQSYQKLGKALVATWSDEEPAAKFGIEFADPKRNGSREIKQAEVSQLKAGDSFQMRLEVEPREAGKAVVRSTFSIDGVSVEAPPFHTNQADCDGFVGIAARGLIDFEINSFSVTSTASDEQKAGHCECLGCWSLGDSLTEVDGKWQVRFVSLFASDGETAELRISSEENPSGGWENVAPAGSAAIVNHEWRRNTSTITATLPANPADTDLFYTIWKDGENVTADDRIGTPAVGPGTGFVGDVPSSGSYVGRLPRLQAPYRLGGFSCHAISGGLQKKTEEGFQLFGRSAEWEFRDQPSEGCYAAFEDYNLQILVWEDDVWYLELVLYPPSTDDAYKVIANSICGPTSRWQMMRHWNVINPGDHDYGMDDVKGPEQIAIRKHEGLGQDPEYMKRNFQIVHHLVTGDEEVDPLANPKKWRAWKMPNRDFTFVICDSRLWRSSQDTDIWDDAGWAAFKNLYDRTDPTRSLLGEEQFGWLQELIATDSSPLMVLTGVNGLHTVWTGQKGNKDPENEFNQRDRVTADYAGWVKAGADRVLELLGSRDGVVTVYGDVHNGCIMTNHEHRVVEACFGPIGRSGGRAVISGFGPEMKDFDGREISVHALYHKEYADAALNPHGGSDPFYWNFLEMIFDPEAADPSIEMKIRNLIDGPGESSRGGGELLTAASQTGRETTCRLPAIKTLPNADVRLVEAETGRTLRGIRSRGDGSISLRGLPDVKPGTRLLVTAYDGESSRSEVIETS